MSCNTNDIILSFLEDIAQDVNWEESFQFPESVLSEVRHADGADTIDAMPIRPVNSDHTHRGFPSKLAPVAIPSASYQSANGDHSPVSISSNSSSDCATSGDGILSGSSRSRDRPLEIANGTPPHSIDSSASNSSTIESPGFSDCSAAGHISSVDGNNSGSDFEDYDFERQLVDIDWGITDQKYDWVKSNDADAMITSKGLKLTKSQRKAASWMGNCINKGNKNPLVRLKKRKYEASCKKKDRLSAEEMLICVVNFLREKNSPQQDRTQRKPVKKDPYSVAHGFLQNLLGVVPTSADSLLTFMAPVGVLESGSLSSLADRVTARQQQVQQQAKSWSSIISTESSPGLRFPERHEGIIKINSAARKFANTLAVLLDPNVINHETMSFVVTINHQNSILSKTAAQLAAPFTWKSDGLLAFGYSSELEFNGFIRCTFNSSGTISTSLISFDACSLVRHCHMLENHGNTAVSKQSGCTKMSSAIAAASIAAHPATGVTMASIVNGLPAAH